MSFAFFLHHLPWWIPLIILNSGHLPCVFVKAVYFSFRSGRIALTDSERAPLIGWFRHQRKIGGRAKENVVSLFIKGLDLFQVKKICFWLSPSVCFIFGYQSTRVLSPPLAICLLFKHAAYVNVCESVQFSFRSCIFLIWWAVVFFDCWSVLIGLLWAWSWPSNLHTTKYCHMLILDFSGWVDRMVSGLVTFEWSSLSPWG